MNIISWNVNGLRSCIAQGFEEFLASSRADILCLQEIKISQMESQQLLKEASSMYPYMEVCSGQKKGYAGTMLLSKERVNSYPLDLSTPMQKEGRVQVVELCGIYLVNIYVPTTAGSRSFTRQIFRHTWEEDLITKIGQLLAERPVILCGDFNTARGTADIAKGHARRQPREQSFLWEDTELLFRLEELGMCDTYRLLHPSERDIYTWWSNRGMRKLQNQGCRLDYILASGDLKEKIIEAEVLSQVQGSDHCPVLLELNI